MNNIRLPIPKDLIIQLKECKPLVAGGWCLSIIQNQEGIPSEYNDVDLFFENKDNYNKALSILTQRNEHFKQGYENDNAVVLISKSNFAPERSNLNLVKIFKSHADTLKGFDFLNSQMFSLWPFDEIKKPSKKGILSNLFFNEKEMKNGINLGWISRASKYYKQKNLNISEESATIIFNYLKNWRRFSKEDYKGHGYDKINTENTDRYLEHIFSEILKVYSVHHKFLNAQETVPLPFKNMISANTPKHLIDFHQVKAELEMSDFETPESYKDSVKFMKEHFPEEYL